MPAHIHGKRCRYSAQPGDFLQILVDTEHRALVLAAQIDGWKLEDGKQIILGTACRILGDNRFHAAFPFDVQLLPRLMPAVTQYPVLQVGLLEVRHVNERHTTGVKRKEEHVPRQFPMRFPAQVKFLNVLDVFEMDGTFWGLVHSGIDMLEWMLLHGQPFSTARL